jgi:RNA polymerase sigma-70 factor (ECF subfamily)
MIIPIDTDESLFAEAQQGSHDAFGELLSRYQHRAYATAVSVLSDFDLAQEAFLRAYHDLPKLKDPARFGAWVSGIAILDQAKNIP